MSDAVTDLIQGLFYSGVGYIAGYFTHMAYSRKRAK